MGGRGEKKGLQVERREEIEVRSREGKRGGGDCGKKKRLGKERKEDLRKEEEEEEEVKRLGI